MLPVEGEKRRTQAVDGRIKVKTSRLKRGMSGFSENMHSNSSQPFLQAFDTPSATIPSHAIQTHPRLSSLWRETIAHQSSPQPSSLPLPPATPPFIAFVPRVLGLPCSAVTSEAPKLSQKSCRSGTTLPLLAAPLAFSSWPSTNLLSDSAAPLAPD